MVTRTTKSSVLFGEELHRIPPQLPCEQAVCTLSGNARDGKQYQIPLTKELLSKHIMLLGGIGTGKTNTFFQIVSQLKEKMSDDDVMIVFDTKGDFYKEFYRPGDIVISNDETATGGDELDYWNIFNEISDDSHMLESIIEISKSIFAEACEKTNQIFFPNAAKDLFMASLLHFMRSIEPSQCTNKNLIEFLNYTPSDEFRNIIMQYPDLRAMTSYIANDDSAQTQGVISELQQVVREIFIGNFAKHGTLSLKNLVQRKGGKTIFIEYDLSLGSMLTPIYSLMFDIAIKTALGRKRSEGNVYFITDEFRLLPNLKHIDDAVNFGRSNTSCDFQPQSRVEQLLKIDDAIQKRISNIQVAQKFIKQQDINIKLIADDAQISRKTFYNHELLQLYVEYCAAKVNSDLNATTEEINQLKTKNAELEATIQQFLLRDLETENLRRDLKATRQELSHLKRVNDELTRQCEKLLSENRNPSLKRTKTITVPKERFAHNSDN